MEFSGKKTSILNCKTLIFGFVFFLFAISLFSLVSVNLVHAQEQYFEGPNDSVPQISSETITTTTPTTPASKSTSEVCSFLINPVGCLVSPLFYFATLLLSMSQAIFGWIIDADNIKTVFGNNALYELWTYVRDILNMFFIMMLLFSAFCTIFRIEQYNYKKLLWKIVLMALLVNFSFPITRFIIDASNILMYTLLKSLLAKPEEAFVELAKNGSLSDLMNPKGYPSAKFLLGSTVLIFMLAVTFLAIGVLLMIRIIALAILLIFSPVAFAGSFVPGLSSHASKWWDYLFKYSFFGPIMIFGVIIAVKLMTAVGTTLSAKAITAAGKQSGDATFLGAMIFILVPIILLWIVMGVAQSMSIAGAGAVMGGAQKVMKGAGKKFSGYNAIKRQYDSYAGERKKRQAEKNKDNFGGTIGKTLNRKQDELIGAMPVGGGAARKRVEETERRAVQEQRDEWKKQGGADETQLDAALGSRNSAKKKAAAMEMAEKNGFGDGTNRAADLARYQKAADAVKGDRVNEKAFKDKVEEKHIRLAIEDDIARGGKTKPKAYDDNLKNMNADALSKQKHLLDQDDFHDNFLQAKKTTDPRFIQEVAKKINTATRLDWRQAANPITGSARGYKI